jgi:hypothetical protein
MLPIVTPSTLGPRYSRELAGVVKADPAGGPIPQRSLL